MVNSFVYDINKHCKVHDSHIALFEVVHAIYAIGRPLLLFAWNFSAIKCR